jgi:hypothetical protein
VLGNIPDYERIASDSAGLTSGKWNHRKLRSAGGTRRYGPNRCSEIRFAPAISQCFGKFDAHFVTAAYLFVDLEKSLLHYSAAAHSPLLLASGTAGKVVEFEENGVMLGMFSESVYSSVGIHLGDGITKLASRRAE